MKNITSTFAIAGFVIFLPQILLSSDSLAISEPLEQYKNHMEKSRAVQKSCGTPDRPTGDVAALVLACSPQPWAGGPGTRNLSTVLLIAYTCNLLI